MKILASCTLIFAFYKLQAQVPISAKIDTSNQKTISLINFINTYMSQDTISNALWHPKYKTKLFYNYNMDWIWGEYSPKQIAKKFDLELVELQSINDTLSYFKLLARSKPDKKTNTYTNVYKYYIVKIGDKYYLDNCKDYDFKSFISYQTRNIHFYLSPFYKLNFRAMEKASRSLDSLSKAMKRPLPKKPIEYYMCSNEGELNNIANIVIWNGGLTGFTNSQDGYVVGINDNPSYVHEFVHAILGFGADCFFLQEGMATLYGGSNKGKTSYQQGIKELKDCYNTGNCTFEKLYAREVDTKYSSVLSYTFAAACCKYLINQYGIDFLYSLYYNKNITSGNFLEKVIQKTGKSRNELKTGIEKFIL